MIWISASSSASEWQHFGTFQKNAWRGASVIVLEMFENLSEMFWKSTGPENVLDNSRFISHLLRVSWVAAFVEFSRKMLGERLQQ